MLFYVQHLLGIGHLVRGARVARALAAGHFDVTVVTGGVLPPGLDFGRATVEHLPPVKAGPGGFADLVSLDGTIFGPDAKAARRDRLLACFAAVEPDVLLIEAFPFGRRQMRFELLPLIDAAVARTRPPVIAASVRDILQEGRKPERDAETVDLVKRRFDRVVVHGDPVLARFEDSFPRANEIADQIAYSGLVGPDRSEPAAAERFDVIVSAGGGAVGEALIRCSLAARSLSRMAGASWLILTGPNFPAGAVMPAEGVTLRRFEPDLAARLRGAQVSVSQAGYNTVADLMAAPACRAVLVPYAAGGETEQARRATLLQARDWAITLAERDLDPPTLAAAIDRSLDLAPRPSDIGLDGAAQTNAILEDALDRKRASIDAGR